MLVLKRKIRQRIVIDGPCVITLVDSTDGSARIGIDANRDTLVMREEVYDLVNGSGATDAITETRSSRR